MGRQLASDPRRHELETIYREHHRRVRWVLRGRGVTDDALDDLVHEVFLATFRRLPERDPAVPMATWVAGVARNVAFSHRRAAARRLAAAHRMPEPSAGVEPDEAVARHRAWGQLQEFLTGLDDEQREVFVLADLLGMRVPEVATVVDAPLNTLYSRLRIARRRFGDRFGADPQAQLQRAAAGEAPSAAQRQHAWMLLATELFPAPAGPVAVAGSSVGKSLAGKSLAVKLLLVGGAAVGLTAVSAVALRRPEPPPSRPTVAEAPARPVAAKRAEAATDAGIAPAATAAPPVVPAPIEPPLQPAVQPAVQPAKPASPRPTAPTAKPPATALPETDVLAETVEALRAAQRQVKQGHSAAALATLDGLPPRSDRPMGRERHRIERDAACATGDLARATRAHAALVALGASQAQEPACAEKSTAP